MKYYSEVLRKKFDSEKDCLKAEKEYQDQLDEAERKEKELKAARKTRAKEVEDALSRARDARDEYNRLLTEFCKDYGVFHTTTALVPNRHSLFDLFELF
jgi:hypothetical protein